MARIRTVKPEIRDDVKLARVSRDARLTFVYLITAADDDGLVLATARKLVGDLYQHDDDITPTMVRGWCDELAGIGVIRWRETKDGQAVIQIVNWEKHQNIKHRAKPVLALLLVPHPFAPEAVPSASGQPPEGVPSLSGKSPEDVPSSSGGAPETLRRTGGEYPPPTKHLAPSTEHHTPSTQQPAVRVNAASAHHCVLLAAAANRGMSEALGGLQEPIVYSTGHAFVRDLAEREVPLDFALERVYLRARRVAKVVRSLGYFTESVLEDWARHEALQQAAQYQPASAAADPVVAGESRMFLAMARRQAEAGDPEFVAWCTERGVPFTPAHPAAQERIA